MKSMSTAGKIGNRIAMRLSALLFHSGQGKCELSLGTHFRRDRRGSIAISFAIGVVALLIAVGATVDLSRILQVKENLQNSLDKATVSAAEDTTSEYATTGLNVLTANLVAEGTSTEKLTSSFVRNDDSSVLGKASLSVDLAFASILGISTVTIDTSALAKVAGGSTATTDSERICILLKATQASQSLLVNSGANINAPDCAIHVASSAGSAAVFNGGSSIETSRICIKGTQILDNGGVHPNTELGCDTVSDPYAGTLPTPDTATCDHWSLNVNGGAVTLNPGTYCGGINFNSAPTVTFNPGLYVIKSGSWNVNGGSWTGKGVTFYFADSSYIQFNTGVKATLSAPTSGTYANLLIFEPPTLPYMTNWVLNDSPGHLLSGLIYLPNRNVTINSGSTASIDKTTMVFNTLILDQMSWNFAPDPGSVMTTSDGTTSTGKSGNVYLAE